LNNETDDIISEDNNDILNGGKGDDTDDESYVIPTFVPKTHIYSEPKNTPFIPNNSKKQYTDMNQTYSNNPTNQSAQIVTKDNKQQGQILNLQLYQPPKPKSNTNTGMYPNPAVFYPNYNANQMMPYNQANPLNSLVYPAGQPPVYKEYNININGIAGSQVKTSLLFEDVLPIKDVSGTFNSIGERITMHEFIRSMFFSNGDGNDMPIDKGMRNMLSRLKILNMNPYNASRLSNNPYKGLPYGFLLYRTCYPIQLDKQTSSSVCSPKATGANIRIYKMTDESYNINKLEKIKINDFDEWRDITFYTYIRENIIKKKLCPHFPIMFGFNITVSSSIKFDNIHKQNNIIDKHFNSGKSSSVNQKGGGDDNIDVDVLDGMNKVHYDPFPKYEIKQSVRQKYLADYKKNNKYDEDDEDENKKEYKKKDKKNKDDTEDKEDTEEDKKEEKKYKVDKIQLSHQKEIEMLKQYTGKTIVCLTESYHYSILGWATKEYRSDGSNIKTMINMGYHPTYVWESILFQLIVALYVLQTHKIVINNFNIGRHVFIRDIDSKGVSTNYWKYKINGIEYFIPNYGYVLLIDTNFKDFDNEETRKLEGDIFNDNITDIHKKSFEMFKSSFDTNIFNGDFVNNNGIKPPEDVLSFINKIKDSIEDDKNDISYYIRKHMSIFINNRIGTPLKENETSNIRKNTLKEFRKGQIVVMTDENNVDRYVLHVEQKEGESHIIKREDMTNMKNFTEDKVPSSSLFEYVNIETLQQNTKTSDYVVFNDDNLLETYII